MRGYGEFNPLLSTNELKQWHNTVIITWAFALNISNKTFIVFLLQFESIN